MNKNETNIYRNLCYSYILRRKIWRRHLQCFSAVFLWKIYLTCNLSPGFFSVELTACSFDLTPHAFNSINRNYKVKETCINKTTQAQRRHVYIHA